VCAVLINGRVAFCDGAFDRALGRAGGFGQFLPGGGRAVSGSACSAPSAAEAA
jgi:hypothetical protein